MDNVSGQDICILGGTGSIGNALIERLLQYDPRRIRCVSNDEYSMWQTEQRFGTGDHNPMRYVLKDIRNRHAVREVLRGVDVLFMLAAYKHVQYVEYSPQEAIDVNIVGNMNVIEEAIANGRIQKVVNISTDKVCYANNTYGLSKHLIEKVVEWASFYRPQKEQLTKFANVRFGNVIGSRGSVLEKWFDPKTVKIGLRDCSHLRFFMQTGEAIDLTLNCLDRMSGGETFIFKMPVVKIGDLADVVSQMTGKEIEKLPAMLGEMKHQWLMMAEESTHRIDEEHYYLLHRNYPVAPMKDYSTKDQKPLSKPNIRIMLKEWER